MAINRNFQVKNGISVGVGGTILVSSGNSIGIGTTNPSQRLDVQGNANINGDLNISSGGIFTTTVQTVTPTANRVVSFPDATGTVGLVAGSTGQVTYNNAGTQAGDANFIWNAGTGLSINRPFTNSTGSTASTPAKLATGTWFTGGTSTTTKPHFLIEPTGTTSNNWSTNGTGLGINAATGFAGNLLDLQVNGTRIFNVTSAGISGIGGWGIDNLGNINTNYGGITTGFNVCILNNNGIGIQYGKYLGIGSFGVAGSDTFLYSDIANTFAQRNSTSPQTFRLYNTYTDASNYERGKLQWSSNILNIGTENAGTGVSRALALQTNNTTRVFVGAGGSVGIGTITPNRRFVVSGDNTSSQFNSVISVQTTNTTGFGAYIGLNATSVTGGRDWRILSSGTGDTAGAGALSIFDVTAGLTRMTIGTGGSVGIGTTIPSQALDVNGTLHIGSGNSNSFQTYTQTAIATTAATTISSGSTTAFRSARYQVQISQGIEYQAADILAIHNGTTASFIEYGNISTGSTALGAFNVLITGGNLALQVTMNSATAAVAKVHRFALGV